MPKFGDGFLSTHELILPSILNLISVPWATPKSTTILKTCKHNQ